MIFRLLMQDYTSALSSSAEDKRSSRGGAELLPRSGLPAGPTLPLALQGMLLPSPIQVIVVSVRGPREHAAVGGVSPSRQSQGHRVVRPRLRTPCHHPGERRVVTRPQSWRRASLPGASLKDRSGQRAPGRSEAPSSGPAGCSSPAEARAKPPLLSLLHVPSRRWLAAPRGLGYRWGAARVGRGFKAGSSQR